MRNTSQNRFKSSDIECTDRTDLASPRLVSSRLGEVDEKNISETERDKIRTTDSAVDQPRQSTSVKISSSLDLGIKGAERNENKLLEKNLGKSAGKGAEKSAEKSAVQVVPCWILINLSHNSQPDGDVPNGTATTAMKVSNIILDNLVL